MHTWHKHTLRNTHGEDQYPELLYNPAPSIDISASGAPRSDLKHAHTHARAYKQEACYMPSLSGLGQIAFWEQQIRMTP